MVFLGVNLLYHATEEGCTDLVLLKKADVATLYARWSDLHNEWVLRMGTRIGYQLIRELLRLRI